MVTCTMMLMAMMMGVILAGVVGIIVLNKHLLRKVVLIMATLNELKEQVAANTSLEQSAIVLIEGIAQKLQDLIDNGADPVALQQMVDELKTSADALSTAIQANTPQTPTE